jgi:hypothetical protein
MNRVDIYQKLKTNSLIIYVWSKLVTTYLNTTNNL